MGADGFRGVTGRERCEQRVEAQEQAGGACRRRSGRLGGGSERRLAHRGCVKPDLRGAQVQGRVGAWLGDGLAGVEFQASGHELEQSLPAGEEEVARQGLEIIEEGLAGD